MNTSCLTSLILSPASSDSCSWYGVLMAHDHEDGWPLGLGALNARAGVVRSVGSASSTAAFTPSHYVSSFASSDVDTESAWSLPRGGGGGGGGMTLATLIGLVDAMENRRSSRGGDARASRSGKLRALLLSLCLRSHLENGRSAAPSLGQFLEMERRASGSSRHVHRMLPWSRAS